MGIGLKNPERKVTPAVFEADYRFILDASRKANPGLRLVLVDPFVLPVRSPRPGSSEGPQFQANRRKDTDRLRAVVARLAKEYDAVHIKMQDIFDDAAEKVPPEKLLWDGIHPLPMGHELIARQWLRQVGERWPGVPDK